jgi:hypothetical protein
MANIETYFVGLFELLEPRSDDRRPENGGHHAVQCNLSSECVRALGVRAPNQHV